MLSNRPVAFGPRSVNVLRNNNENSAARSSVKGVDTTISKTPAGGKSRRAFGDISNQHPGSISSKGLLPKTPSVVLKPKSTTVVKTVSKTATKPLAVKTNTTRHVEFSIPTDHFPKEKTKEATKAPSTEDAWFLVEPEKPYGRTYLQQLDFDESDEDTVLSLEGVRTLREDWEDLREKSIGLEVERREKEFQQQLQNLDKDIELFAKSEGK